MSLNHVIGTIIGVAFVWIMGYAIGLFIGWAADVTGEMFPIIVASLLAMIGLMGVGDE